MIYLNNNHNYYM